VFSKLLLLLVQARGNEESLTAILAINSLRQAQANELFVNTTRRKPYVNMTTRELEYDHTVHAAHCPNTPQITLGGTGRSDSLSPSA
jgi:hypothetical protein